MENRDHGNKFFSGFLFGAIIGGGIVFLLGTEKGKKILASLTEEGLENFNEFMEEGAGDEEIEEEVEEIVEEKSPNGNGISEKKEIKEVKEEKPSVRKRFFRKK
jgi:DNA-binding PadR family transcriptional regulator